MRTISHEEWVSGARSAVLATLDTYVREMLAHDEARGWTDRELPDESCFLAHGRGVLIYLCSGAS